jgi:hypothetical protein
MLGISLLTKKLRFLARMFPKGVQVSQRFLGHHYFKWHWLHGTEVSCRLQKCHRPTWPQTAVTIPLIFDTNLVIIGIWVCAYAPSKFHCFLPYILTANQLSKGWNCIMTNVMHKFLIYFSLYFCLICFGLSFSPGSEAGVQFRQWFKSPGYGVSAWAVML